MMIFGRPVRLIKSLDFGNNVPETLQTVNDTAYKYMFRSPIAASPGSRLSVTVTIVLSSGYEKCFPVALDAVGPCCVWLFVPFLHSYLRFLYFCNSFMYLAHCFEH